MNKNKHLTLDNRIFIEKNLDEGKSIHQIAVALGKSDSSISREIQRNRYKMPVKQYSYYPCIHRLSMCGVMHLCDEDCNRTCNGCMGYCSTSKCKDYIPEQCQHIKKAPYVCNVCQNINRTNCIYRLILHHFQVRYLHPENIQRRTQDILHLGFRLEASRCDHNAYILVHHNQLKMTSLHLLKIISAECCTLCLLFYHT